MKDVKMRKITQQAAESFWSRSHGMNKDNTVVVSDEYGAKLFLHGNLIAEINKDKLIISSCGWETTTTKERLNGILSKIDYRIRQKNYTWELLRWNSIASKWDYIEPFVDGMVIEL